MNTFERRRVIKERVVDVAVAKTAVNESRRRRREAARKLQKDMAAARFGSSRQADAIASPYC